MTLLAAASTCARPVSCASSSSTEWREPGGAKAWQSCRTRKENAPRWPEKRGKTADDVYLLRAILKQLDERKLERKRHDANDTTTIVSSSRALSSSLRRGSRQRRVQCNGR